MRPRSQFLLAIQKWDDQQGLDVSKVIVPGFLPGIWCLIGCDCMHCATTSWNRDWNFDKVDSFFNIAYIQLQHSLHSTPTEMDCPSHSLPLALHI